MDLDSNGKRRASIKVGAGVLLVVASAGAQERGAPATTSVEDDPVVWTTDANIGALRPESDDLQLAGDATLGIGQRFWGIEGWGSGSAYELINDQVASDTTKIEGTGEAWYTMGERGDPFRLSLRASGGGVNYSSTVENKTQAVPGSDETSWMGRGMFLLGARMRPASTLSMSVHAGGGVQYEWYDSTSAAGGTVEITDTQDLSFVGRGRVDATWIVAPEVVSIRGRVLATYFRLNRDQEFLSAGGGTTQQDLTATTYEQLEVHARAFVDIDAAALFGFRPTLHAGLDHVRVSGDGDTTTTTMPVFGGGLLRPWM